VFAKNTIFGDLGMLLAPGVVFIGFALEVHAGLSCFHIFFDGFVDLTAGTIMG